MNRLIFSLVVGILFGAHLKASTYYVSTTGNDTTNPGTIDLPFKTIPKAISASTIGDTIYVRGGTHLYSTTITISRQGTSSSRCYLLAFPGERPLIDFSAMPIGSSNRGISLTGSYWYIKGFDVGKATDNGMHIRGSNNVVEFCSFFENGDTGLQLDNGASYNQIINCDSYFNVDPSQGNADGFAPKLGVGTGNYFYGCRAWQNSDDGWDGYLRGANNMTTTIENCWCFMNGYLKSGAPSTGNGNGYKMGGSDDRTLQHDMILKNCLAFDNRVKGFDQNNNKGSMTLYNCTAYRNGANYSVSQALAAGETLRVANSVALGAYGSIGSFAIQQTNGWMPPFVVTIDDFLSTDTTGVRGPRNPDGSLPTLAFMHLATGSDLIDAGTDVGIPYNGSAPDLGCFETDAIPGVEGNSSKPNTYVLEQNYPNPFNPTTIIEFSIKSREFVSLRVFDVLGREVVALVNEVLLPGSHRATFDGTGLPTGAYFYRLRSGSVVETKQLLLLK